MAFLAGVVPALTGAAEAAAVGVGRAAQAVGQAASAAGRTVSQGAQSAAQAVGNAAEQGGLAVRNMMPTAAQIGSPGEAANLFSSPLAQDLGVGRGAVFSAGGQVGQGGMGAVPASPQIARAVQVPGATGGALRPDWSGIARKMMGRMGGMGRQQQDGGYGGGAPTYGPISFVPSPAAREPALPMEFFLR